MKVRLFARMATPDFIADGGDVVDLPDAVAKELIRTLQAEPENAAGQVPDEALPSKAESKKKGAKE